MLVPPFVSKVIVKTIRDDKLELFELGNSPRVQDPRIKANAMNVLTLNLL